MSLQYNREDLYQTEEERKRHELEQQKRAQELAQLQKDIEEEEKRLKEFNDWLEDWERAERMRQFIAAYTEKSRSWPAEKQPKYREWIPGTELYPFFLPHGDHYLATRAGNARSADNGIWLGSMHGADLRQILPDASSAQFMGALPGSQTGAVLFTRGDTLMALPFDARS